MGILSKRVVITFFKKAIADNSLLLKKYNNFHSIKHQSTIVPGPGLYYRNNFKNLRSYLESVTFKTTTIKYRCTFSNVCRNCWKCGEHLNDLQLFCDKCTSLQQVNANLNHFEIIGIKSSYEINLSELSTKYRKLQAVLHPDKYGSKTEEEKLISQEYSALVNKAYSTLSHPLERGIYMLKLNGSEIEEGTVQMDKQFLMEIMEINEEIENESDPMKLNKLNEDNKTCLHSLSRQLAEAFGQQNIIKAKTILTKMKYYSSIEEKIKTLKQSLGIPD